MTPIPAANGASPAATNVSVVPTNDRMNSTAVWRGSRSWGRIRAVTSWSARRVPSRRLPYGHTVVMSGRTDSVLAAVGSVAPLSGSPGLLGALSTVGSVGDADRESAGAGAFSERCPAAVEVRAASRSPKPTPCVYSGTAAARATSTVAAATARPGRTQA